ncbi:YjfK family protein [Alteromonas facilis]|uniref:YjfK family protein n=1 Tax=Alteromonas facilis TaxID=2048004 RepID=UPI000C29444F|nr:YjfK family protein [Alteromonas facilis]
MFKKWFGKTPDTTPKAPEIMGLYLGGSFELDSLKLRLLVPDLMIEEPASKHIIQAVGEVHLDSGGKMLRFYTDDDAFLQVVLDGGDTEAHITDVKLWYFYETLTVGNEQQWQQALSHTISKPSYTLADVEFTRVWNAVGEESPPVAFTEKTYEEDGDTSQTDQFMMLYERPIGEQQFESLLVAGEEKIIGQNADRCIVISTGFDIQPADIKIYG